jgi:hypothetical protein
MRCQAFAQANDSQHGGASQRFGEGAGRIRTTLHFGLQVLVEHLAVRTAGMDRAARHGCLESAISIRMYGNIFGKAAVVFSQQFADYHREYAETAS